MPYPPADLRAFDADHDARPLGLFPRMQIHPQWPLDGMIHLSDNRRLVTSYHLGPTTAQPPLAVHASPAVLLSGSRAGRFELTEFGKTHDPTGSHAHHYLP